MSIKRHIEKRIVSCSDYDSDTPRDTIISHGTLWDMLEILRILPESDTEEDSVANTDRIMTTLSNMIQPARTKAPKGKRTTAAFKHSEESRRSTHIAKIIYDSIYATNNTWRGGTLAELRGALSGKIDLSKHHALLKDTSSVLGPLIANMRQVIKPLPQRRRVLSEHDGEWDYDRRNDIEPFMRVQRQASMRKSIVLRCHFGANGYVNADTIDAHGALVWAVCQLLENAGITAQIDVIYTTRGIDADHTVHAIDTVRIKDAGQYIAPAMLATVFSSNFFRRVCFASNVLTCDSQYLEVSPNLGSAVSPTRTTYTNGVIDLALGQINKQTEKELLEALLEAIK